MRYAIGDAVRLRDEALHGPRRELKDEIGRVGDSWDEDGTARCTVVYEAWDCLIWDAPVTDFEPASTRRPTAH